jgi:hypothetical protein
MLAQQTSSRNARGLTGRTRLHGHHVGACESRQDATRTSWLALHANGSGDVGAAGQLAGWRWRATPRRRGGFGWCSWLYRAGGIVSVSAC